MEHKPFLSVIMPVYNGEQYVKQAVESVLAQTFTDLEVICVNDASADNSLSVLLDLQKSDARVKVIDSKENVGAGGARNLGLDVAVGTYVTFVDADDTIEPDLYERAVAVAGSSDADEIVWGLVEEHYDADGQLVRTVPIVPASQVVTEPLEITAAVLQLEEKTLFGYQWNSFYRNSILQEHGIRFEEALFYEDYFFNLAFARRMRSLATMDFVGYHYFKRVNASITHQFTKDYFDLSYRRVDEMVTFLQQRGYTKPCVYTVLGNRLLRYTLSALQRNCDPRSKMDYKARKQWFLAMRQLPLYAQLLPKAKISNPAHAVLAVIIKCKLCLAADLTGRLIDLVMRRGKRGS